MEVMIKISDVRLRGGSLSMLFQAEDVEHPRPFVQALGNRIRETETNDEIRREMAKVFTVLGEYLK